MDIIRRLVPYDAAQSLHLIEQVFGSDEAELETYQLNGSECAHNTDIVYEARENGQLLGMIHATIPKNAPTLCGLSAMCTAPQSRGLGIGRLLFEQIVREIDQQGVETAFLGTGNPLAAKLYRSTGFSYLIGSGVMVRCCGEDITDFIKRTFLSEPQQLRLVSGSPALRIPMIPFIVQGGIQKILDINTGLFNSGFITQLSCMSLYPRYHALTQKGGNYWAAVNEHGIPCAMMSILPTQCGLRMDLSCSQNICDSIPQVFASILEREAPVYMQIADIDVKKQQLAQRLGFHKIESSSVMLKCGSFHLPVSTYACADTNYKAV